MKKLLFIISLIGIAYISKSQSNSADDQAIKTLKEFYTAHCKIWAIRPVPPPDIFNGKLDSLQKKYCTPRLIKKAKDALKDVGYDLFTNDWGIDTESLKTMTIAKDPMRINTYIVSYIVVAYPQVPSKPVMEHVILHVTLTKESGRLKITSIEDSTKRFT